MSPDTQSQPKIRLLHCHVCKTIDEIPDWDGPLEEDYALEYTLRKHKDHVGKLYDVEERVWRLDNLRSTIIEQIKGGSKGLAAFDPEFYNTRDNIKEDALKCYSLHNRPKEGCIDWRDDRKLLLPPTKDDRKEVGLDMSSAPRRWLCDFCPARSYYERKNRGD